jgi:hypothetical protein
MKLDWDRPGVVRATLKVEELAAVVAGARLAAAALAAQSPEQAEQLARVLASFDRALAHLRQVPAPPVADDADTAAVANDDDERASRAPVVVE